MKVVSGPDRGTRIRISLALPDEATLDGLEQAAADRQPASPFR